MRMPLPVPTFIVPGSESAGHAGCGPAHVPARRRPEVGPLVTRIRSLAFTLEEWSPMTDRIGQVPSTMAFAG